MDRFGFCFPAKSTDSTPTSRSCPRALGRLRHQHASTHPTLENAAPIAAPITALYQAEVAPNYGVDSRRVLPHTPRFSPIQDTRSCVRAVASPVPSSPKANFAVCLFLLLPSSRSCKLKSFLRLDAGRRPGSRIAKRQHELRDFQHHLCRNGRRDHRLQAKVCGQDPQARSKGSPLPPRPRGSSSRGHKRY